MAICTECKSKIPTLDKRLMRVNSELHQLGLEYHATLSHSLNAAERILVKHGFTDQSFYSTFPTGTSGKFHNEVGEGKWLSLSWYRMESGNYEIVAYVN